MIRITFEPDENRDVNDVATPISIVDDLIDEATEQVFVVQLQLNSSVNPGSIDLTTRQTCLCRIIDDDSKWTICDSVSTLISVINPRRMRGGYGSHRVCVCVSVCLSPR